MQLGYRQGLSSIQKLHLHTSVSLYRSLFDVACMSNSPIETSLCSFVDPCSSGLGRAELQTRRAMVCAPVPDRKAHPWYEAEERSPPLHIGESEQTRRDPHSIERDKSSHASIDEMVALSPNGQFLRGHWSRDYIFTERKSVESVVRVRIFLIKSQSKYPLTISLPPQILRFNISRPGPLHGPNRQVHPSPALCNARDKKMRRY